MKKEFLQIINITFSHEIMSLAFKFDQKLFLKQTFSTFYNKNLCAIFLSKVLNLIASFNCNCKLCQK